MHWLIDWLIDKFKCKGSYWEEMMRIALLLTLLATVVLPVAFASELSWCKPLSGSHYVVRCPLYRSAWDPVYKVMLNYIHTHSSHYIASQLSRSVPIKAGPWQYSKICLPWSTLLFETVCCWLTDNFFCIINFILDVE